MTTKKPGKPSLSATESKRVRQALDRLYFGRFKENGTALAKALGRSQPAIAQLRNGTNLPSLDTARRIAKLEAVPVTMYLDETADDGAEDGEFPSKHRAARAARLLGFDDDAVETMLTEPVPKGVVSDPGALFWYRRVEMIVSATPQAAEHAPRTVERSRGARRALQRA